MTELKVKKGADRLMKGLHMIAFTLLIIGGLNWGLIALFGFDLVQTVFGAWPMLVKLVYVAVGVSTVYVVVTHKGDCKICGK